MNGCVRHDGISVRRRGWASGMRRASQCGSVALLAACTLGQSTPGGSTSPAPAAAGDVAMIEPTGAGAVGWPRWRGPSGQGGVRDGGNTKQWADGENVLGEMPVPGVGES